MDGGAQPREEGRRQAVRRHGKSHARGVTRQRCPCSAVGCEDNDGRREVGDGKEVVERIMYF